MTAPTFALVGVGFVAGRHIDAIHQVGGKLIAACDPHDSVGILDRYAQDVAFDLAPYEAAALPHTDYVVIASPNHLHAEHCRIAMENGSDVICEKPVALTPAEVDELRRVEVRTGRKVWPILQLRLHPAVLAYRRHSRPHRERATVRVEYVTPRGPWYASSWKGFDVLSGGIATNLGVHLFDLLLWLFGEMQGGMSCGDATGIAGRLILDRADVSWSLGTVGPRRRVLTIDGVELDLSEGFESLHPAVYREILAGRWHPLGSARPAVELCASLRSVAAVAPPR